MVCLLSTADILVECVMRRNQPKMREKKPFFRSGLILSSISRADFLYSYWSDNS